MCILRPDITRLLAIDVHEDIRRPREVFDENIMDIFIFLRLLNHISKFAYNLFILFVMYVVVKIIFASTYYTD